MLALHPRVVTAIWAAVQPRLPELVDEHPLGCNRPRRDDFGAFKPSCFGSSRAVPGPSPGASPAGPSRHFGGVTMNGVKPGCLMVWSPRRWKGMTGSSVLICLRWRSTARSTRHHLVAKGPTAVRDPNPRWVRRARVDRDHPAEPGQGEPSTHPTRQTVHGPRRPTDLAQTSDANHSTAYRWGFEGCVPT